MKEKYIKLDNKWIFVGYGNISKDFEIDMKETKNFIYQTKKYLNGKIEKIRFRKEVLKNDFGIIKK